MKLLLLTSHGDDMIGWLPCYLYLQRKYSVEVKLVCFNQVAIGLPADIQVREEKEWMSMLGIPLKNLCVLQFQTRHFSEYRQEILEKLVEIKRNFATDIVVGPGTGDIHQDHHVIHEEMLRCFKNDTTIIGFDYPWNTFYTYANIFLELDKTMIEIIIASSSVFKSVKWKPYMSEDFIRAQFRATGIKIGKQFAAGYQCIRFRGKL